MRAIGQLDPEGAYNTNYNAFSDENAVRLPRLTTPTDNSSNTPRDVQRDNLRNSNLHAPTLLALKAGFKEPADAPSKEDSIQPVRAYSPRAAVPTIVMPATCVDYAIRT